MSCARWLEHRGLKELSLGREGTIKISNMTGPLKETTGVMEALDIQTNVARDGIGKIECNHVAFLTGMQFQFYFLNL